MMYVKECGTHPTAKEAAALFIQLVVRAHGIPRKIISDRGTQFESTLWYEVMQRMGSKGSIGHYPSPSDKWVN